jgi:hypothetical protein
MSIFCELFWYCFVECTEQNDKANYILSVTDQCYYAECLYNECRYGDSRGANNAGTNENTAKSQNLPRLTKRPKFQLKKHYFEHAVAMSNILMASYLMTACLMRVCIAILV